MAQTGSGDARPAIKIFLSSPGDVNEERVLADRVMKRLAERYAPVARLSPVIWEHEPLLATATFQDQIEKPSSTDIVVCILWSRLGTRLPAHIQREDGSRYDSGTEYEFEDAWRAMQERGRPDLLVYRKMAEPLISLSDDREVEERLRQKRALDGFIQKWFHDQDGSLLAAFHAFRNSAEFEDAFEIHLDKLIQRRLEEMGVDLALPATTAAPDQPRWEGSPFRGLETFEFEHAPIFYGRTHAISGVLDALRRQAAAGQAFVLVLGRSGGGKSSLVRAGVMPLLVEPGVVEGVGLWRRAILRPAEATSDLFEAFAAALTGPDALPELLSDGTTRAELATLLRANPQGAAPLLKGALSQAAQKAAFDAAEATIAAKGDISDADRKAIRGAAIAAPPQARLALLVDQLEELFTAAGIDTATRNAFMEAVAALARSGRVFVVSTLRSDFYHRCMEIPALAALKGSDGQYDLMPPTPAEIAQIIRLPARRAGLSFEEHPDTGARLDDTLRDEAASEPDSLPLLEFTLEELYQARTPAGVLTWEAHDRLGGMAGALGQRAEDAFSALDAAAQAALPSVMRRIVHVGLGQDQAPTKRPAPLDSFAPGSPERRLVDGFVAARLFVVGSADDGAPAVTLTHEAILSSWARLRAWLEKDREFLRIRARVAFAADRWEEAGRDAQLLLPTGLPLEEARQLASGGDLGLSGAERALISQSEARAARGRRLRQGAVAALVALSVAASGAAWYADGQRRAAATSAEIARTAQDRAEASAADAISARGVADAARAQAEENAAAAQAARAEAEDARQVAEASEGEARARLNELFVEQGRKALLDRRMEEAALILGAAYAGDPDPRTGALFSTALDVLGIRGASVLAHPGVIAAAVTGPGALAATASTSGEVTVWDMATGTAVAEYAPADDATQAVRALAFSPRGGRLAFAGDEGVIMLWSYATGEVRRLDGHFESVTRLVFSEDGARLASVSSDKTTRVWSVAEGQQIALLAEPEGAPIAAGFLRGGEAIAVAADSGALAVWSIAGAREELRREPRRGLMLPDQLYGTTRPAIDALFYEDQGLAVLASGNGVIDAVPLGGGEDLAWRLPLPVRGLGRGQGDGTLLVRLDDRVVVLDVATGNEVLRTEAAGPGIAAAVMSPDGMLVSVLDRAGGVTITDIAGGRVIASVRGHDGPGTVLAAATEGTAMISGAADGTATFWSLDALLPCILPGGDGRSVVFSPDGAHVASGDGRGRVFIGDAATCEPRHQISIDPEGGWVQDLAFSADGAVLAATAGGHVVAIDPATGAEVWRHAVPSDRFATGLSWTADDSGVVAGYRASTPWTNSGGWHLLARQDGALRLAATGTDTAVGRTIAENDGRYVLTGGRFGIDLWWIDSGTRRHRIADTGLQSFALWPSQTRIAVGEDTGVVRILRHTNSELLRFAAHDAPVTALAVSPSGDILASGARSGDAALWDAASGQSLARLSGHGGIVAAMAFVPETDFVVSAATDGSVILWDARGGEAVARYAAPAGPAPRIAVSPDGRWLSVATGRGPARLWPLPQPDVPPSGVALAVANLTPWGFSDADELPRGRWQSLALQSLSERLAADGGGDALPLSALERIEAGRLAGVRGDALAMARAWDGLGDVLPDPHAYAAEANGVLLQGLHTVLDAHSERVEDIAFSPDGATLASVDWSGRLVLWNTADWTPRHINDNGLGGTLAFSPDGTRLLSERDGPGMAITGLADGQIAVEIADGDGGSWSPDGTRIAVFPRIGPPRIHDATDGTLLASFPGLDPGSRAYAVAPDFARIAAPSAAGVALIDIASRAAILDLPAPGKGIDADRVVFSEDGSLLAVIWSDRTGAVFDASTGAPRAALPEDVLTVQIAPDNAHALAERSGAEVALIDLATGAELVRVPGSLGGLRAFEAGAALFATAVERGILLYRRDTGAPAGAYLNHATAWTRIAGDSAGRWRVTTSGDGVLRVWDAAAPAGPLEGPADPTPRPQDVLALSGSGVRVIPGEGAARLVPAGGGAELRLSGHRGEITAAAFAADGAQVLTGSSDGRVVRRAAADGALLQVIETGCARLSALAVAADDTVLLAHCDRKDLRLYALLTGRHLLTLPVGPADAIALDGDDALLLLSAGPETRGWRLRR